MTERRLFSPLGWSLFAIIVVFIQKRPQGIFAVKGRAAE